MEDLDENDFKEALIFANNAQEAIRKDFLAEIALLEAQTKPSQNSNGLHRFYSSELRRATSENESLKQQIEELDKVINPDLQQHIEKSHQKRENLENRIKKFQNVRDSTLFERLRDPTQIEIVKNSIIQTLQKEIEELSALQTEYEKRDSALRFEFRSVLDKKIANARIEASRDWDIELSDENFQNLKTRRQRAKTFSQTQISRILRNSFS